MISFVSCYKLVQQTILVETAGWESSTPTELTVSGNQFLKINQTDFLSTIFLNIPYYIHKYF